MLEILIVIWFCRLLARTAREKGRTGTWGGLGAVFWFGGEILGAVAVAGSTTSAGGIYLAALVGAAIGAAIAFVIVASLPPIDDDLDWPTARIA